MMINDDDDDDDDTLLEVEDILFEMALTRAWPLIEVISLAIVRSFLIILLITSKFATPSDDDDDDDDYDDYDDDYDTCI